MNQETGKNKSADEQENQDTQQPVTEDVVEAKVDDIEVVDEEVSEDGEEVIEDEADALAQRIEDLEAQLAKSQDDMMRTLAAMDNLQKRLDRDIQNTRKFANDKIIKALIPVMDSFDKALELAEKDDCEVTAEQMVEGTQMTQKILLQVLKDNGISVLDPKGEKFDPELHEAMTMVEIPGQEKNTVVDVFQKGYLLNDRVIKAAMVVVAK
ncbi:nucleotide exchange factor GrpE [Marinicella sp. W31]|uniref:nucleotide exchange factor GrpE n=1 Tax=Marinicella sp. W31 TaxID=3023713 RepID=UPI0037576CFB